ncbi:MAG TPA: aminoglycoside adenylyltransferase domain-containing protein [Symbiobacteriaceae bacterium]|nr:aminoglycoside adenylyltransferase domain-containing protein [Symbiobacteriaceae bacterium]
MRRGFPTPYAEENALAGAILTGARAALGDQFVGLYLHGSVATGDFDPGRSDIDFLVVTRTDLPDGAVAALNEMHARIAASDLTWTSNYEGSYIPMGALRRYDPAHSIHPVIRCDGSFGLDEHRSEWVIQRHILRERGIAVAGPSPETLVAPVAPTELRQAQKRLLEEWWRPQLAAPFRLADAEYQAYAILTMCRALYTLESGRIASKPEAVRWAGHALEPRWADLAGRALAWRHGDQLGLREGALAFIQYTLDHVGDV